MSHPQPSSYPGASDAERTEAWRAVLTMPGLAPFARYFRWLPGQHRCPLCFAPYTNPFGPIVSRLGFGRSARYPQLCNPCFRGLANSPGGAEVSVTVLFADVRGSTAIAERTSAAEFSALLQGFYALVTEAVQAESGVIDKFLGDGVMALFIPSFTDRHDAVSGLAAARRILAETHLPVGVGLNTGPAFTGFLGATAEVAGFSAVGDAVNVTHRLGGEAAAGELLVSADTLKQADFDPEASGEGWEARELSVKGRDRAVEAWSLRIAPASARDAAA
ncbi:MAG TPA: adenylate/guanylate cyclase domain-containing protein [Candidatus Limnocylindria bacterium]|nr:adenylate/guanylate cyclase domain-containing protein [Candidatus Limnocylindria bacterium]